MTPNVGVHSTTALQTSKLTNRCNATQSYHLQNPNKKEPRPTIPQHPKTSEVAPSLSPGNPSWHPPSPTSTSVAEPTSYGAPSRPFPRRSPPALANPASLHLRHSAAPPPLEPRIPPPTAPGFHGAHFSSPDDALRFTPRTQPRNSYWYVDFHFPNPLRCRSLASQTFVES
ncbi:hypothetical protein KC19_1G064100 [Ceratodon purpureus]|uniref:Uncharacterized protein n=1 Tax=Ceratodon purpureus TaxID=3225 RepID=A0A8T0J5E0_CERPU|nr:hypothetical protein KC19_1G064100 [Ceratodon purpureus]